MKITFCIKGCAIKPIGGHKVLYEYANRLSKRGHDVTIIFPSADNLYQLHLPVGVRVFICKVLTDAIHVLPPWFKFEKKIKIKTTKDYSEMNFPDADYIIATAVETAIPVSELPKRCGKKIYFIQDYEVWGMQEKDLLKTYSLGMQNIVISNWLKDIVEKHSAQKTILVPNAIDTNKFKIFNPIEKRNPLIIGLLYHSGSHKGLKYAFEAIDIVKKKYPKIHVIIFGATKPNITLSDTFEFHYRASEKEVIDIYNRCGIFLCATIDEGFGLTGAESMACGCAFVSTDYKGVKEYAINEVNALLSPVKNSEKLAYNIQRLVEDNDLRLRIAKQGNLDIQKRSWDNAVDIFEKSLSL